MGEIVQGLPTVSARILALYRAGYSRSEIHRYLGKRYQHVRNVLVQAGYLKPQLDQPADGDTAGSSALEVQDDVAEHARVTIGPGGRIVIPAPFREALGLKEGDAVVIQLEDEELRLVSYETELRRIRELVSQHVPEGVSLVDELIAERRREAERELRGD
ncbi:MAG: AbrB/MazE/SpoVT family DNA-binding domain-containing protein [Rhodospirillales bacterium]|nr:AbrB/MazE/SpoVT family DNA-binding domain-containing protein [Rhodospirillales bacterium]